MKNGLILLVFCGFLFSKTFGQELYPPVLAKDNWHQAQRTLRYHPEGLNIVIQNGTKRFNRALYGSHTAFRVEGGDLPEFALYMPGLGGNFKFGFIAGGESKWLIEASKIKSIYRSGALQYEIEDPILGSGKLVLDVQALAKGEGAVVRAKFYKVNRSVQLFWAFGGASGKNFSRNGDMGPDPESVFYLHPENCKGNVFSIGKNSFELTYGKGKKLAAYFSSTVFKKGDACEQKSPLAMVQSASEEFPVITGKQKIENNRASYFLIQNPDAEGAIQQASVVKSYEEAEKARAALANRITINTPDIFINTLGGNISIAADAIWESPSYLHGAIGWRMRLNGWRGAYAADFLGWHDRAQTHFSAYAKSQVLTPPAGPVIADTALNLARSKEQIGSAMFSEGYISREPEGKNIRPHHYDMNLVYIDQLLWHLNWTGNLNYLKEIWPVIKRHLAWEKRVFDPDGDGLYDAYAAIWASDALQYSAGGVTHSSAYLYRANEMASELARLLGEDGSSYHAEAEKIKKAINEQLWLKDKGVFAEFKDALGMRNVHTSPGLWTIYHSIESGVANPFQAYGSLRYVDTEIPHIPIRANGLENASYYTLSTTNWMPYEWSLNNVVMAENMHTALANWQAGRKEEAFKLWKSELLNDQYLGGSPGNFVQISHYDANRGEAYRDFADPIGVSARSLVEGLFGIIPNALHKTLMIKPGLPDEWKYAQFKSPDIGYAYQQTGTIETYTIEPHFPVSMALHFRLKIKWNQLKSVKVNGRLVKWKNIAAAIGSPEIEFDFPADKRYTVEIAGEGKRSQVAKIKPVYAAHEKLKVVFASSGIKEVYDPQNSLQNIQVDGAQFTADVGETSGHKTVFVALKQNQFTYWYPLCFQVKSTDSIAYSLDLNKPIKDLTHFEPQDLSTYFNDQVTQIFQNKYLSPRPQTTTLQLPVQGIGDWPHPLVKPEIDDSGIRRLAGKEGLITLPSGVLFKTPWNLGAKNIVFTSQWDNYPKQVGIPLSGTATAVYFLLAGSTNPMQSRMDNGVLEVVYADGSTDSLPLRNPENWWPIEKDLFTDGFAFNTGATKPFRIHLKSAKMIGANEIEQWNGKEINGGAATALGLQLNPKKELKKLTLRTLSNDVVIGLMSVTLLRNN
ncbi:DUF4450 domain-containing protein [Pedobacter sp. MW01-1-1]|uniref:DUF4450 domain-containing protein n=1 Tax=Pedobacter sp. MW01-1-1 TaxID=3383027 RepID=UPI003FEDB5AA